MVTDIRVDNTAENLRRLIDACNKPLRVIADNTGVPIPTLGNIKTGRHDPTYATILKLADYFFPKLGTAAALKRLQEPPEG